MTMQRARERIQEARRLFIVFPILGKPDNQLPLTILLNPHLMRISCRVETECHHQSGSGFADERKRETSKHDRNIRRVTNQEFADKQTTADNY